MTRFGGLLLLVRRSLGQHLLSTVVTAASIALACGLTMSIFAIKTQTHRAFVIDSTGFDAVLGARGSQLQLVLNAVYHLETSPGNIPWQLYEDVKRNPMVALAIPYAVGDNYRGWRIVGTTTELFTGLQMRAGEPLQFAAGEAFTADSRGAVLGSFAAARSGLKVGDTFHPYHGIIYDPAMQHAATFTITGILAPTNTAADGVIWTPIDSVYRMEGHVLRGDGTEYDASANPTTEIPDSHKEVSAVILKFRSPMAGAMLSQMINQQGNTATLAFPVAGVMLDLFRKLGWLHRVLALLAWITMVVAAASLLASLSNAMNERRREFAILRALGARRRTVFATIIAQSSAIAALGALGGYAVHALIVGVTAVIVRHQVGVVLDPWLFDPVLWRVPLAMLALGAAAGLLPAWQAYRTDVAAGLQPSQ